MPILRRRDAASRSVRSFAVALAAAAALSCGDRGAAGPGIPSRASLAVAPSFEQTVVGGPVIVLDHVKGWLVPIPAADSTFAQATFDGASAALEFDVVVSGAEQRFVFRLAAYDVAGELAFASTDTIHVRAGENEPVDGVQLTYVARDAELTDFFIQARTLSLAAGDTTRLAARACCTGVEQLFDVNAGWISRDPMVATVEQGTGIVTAVGSGRAWIVATLFNGARDSAEVSVGGGVAAVTIAQDMAEIYALGATVALDAVALDAAGAPLDVPISWRSLAPGVATVDESSGLVTAAANGTAPIVAEAGGKADTLGVVVAQTAATLEASVDPDTLNAIGRSGVVMAVGRDANGYPIPGLAIGFAPLHELGAGRVSLGGLSPTDPTAPTSPPPQYPSTATLAAPVGSGEVVGAATTTMAVTPGDAWVEAYAWSDAGQSTRLADSVRIVVRQVAATVTVTPNTRILSAGDTATFSAEARDSAGVVIPAPDVTWSSSALGVATIDGGGVATAVGPGAAAIYASVDEAVGEARIEVPSLPPLTRTWISGDLAGPSDWMNPANWSPRGVPAAGDTVVVAVAEWEPSLWVDATVAALRVDPGTSLHVDRGLVVTGDASGQLFGPGSVTVEGDFTLAAEASVTVGTLRLRAASGTSRVAAGAGFAPELLVLDGKETQPIVSGLAYRSVLVAGSAALAGGEPVTFDGSLTIEGDAAQLAPNGTPLLVVGDLATRGGGLLVLRNDADDVAVKGGVTIDGGPTAAAFLYGTLRVSGDFTVACKMAECFQPAANGNFTVELDGLEKQTVSLALPGAPGDGNMLQRFHDIVVANGAGVIFATGAGLSGDLSVVPAALATIPAGVWVDVVGTISLDRSGSDPGRIENFGELYAGFDDTSADVGPNPVLPRK